MRRLALILVAAVVAGEVALAQSKRVNVAFAPQNKDQQFDAAADEYRRIWAAEGSRIIEAMERISKLKFPDKNVNSGAPHLRQLEPHQRIVAATRTSLPSQPLVRTVIPQPRRGDRREAAAQTRTRTDQSLTRA
jgi:hypothetical protein